MALFKNILLKDKIHFLFIFFVLFAYTNIAFLCYGQNTRDRQIVGIVRDSVSGDPIQSVLIKSTKSKDKTHTDEKGYFKSFFPNNGSLVFNANGYKEASIPVKSVVDTLNIFLIPEATELTEIVIKPKKEKYSKKNNPAVDLILKVREDISKHDPVNKMPFYGYDRYDKTILAINNFNGYIPAEDGQIKGKNKSIAEFIDTAIWTGKRILNLSMKEKFSSRLTSSDGVDKEVVIAQRSNGIDKSLDDGFTRAVFDDFMREVDVYKNDIAILRSRFVSPLATIGPDFYKYEITDTVMIGNDRCIEVSFVPHNKESFGFVGNIFIPLEDSVKYVRRVMLRLPKAANVNFVENLYLSQNFKKDSLGFTHKTLDDMVVELHVVGSIGQVHVSRQSRYDNISYDKNLKLEEFYTKIGKEFVIEEAGNQNSDFWVNARMLPLSYAEQKFAIDESPYKKVPLLYWSAKILEILVKGYVATGKNSKFDFGPIDTFVSYNATEGIRLSVGGMTTANLFKNVFGRGYVAYGLRDNKWKYEAELEYSFNKKKYHAYEFPVNGIRAKYKYDLNSVGQRYLSKYGRSIFSSFSRLQSELSLYEREGSLEYNIEWNNNLSLLTSLHYTYEESTPHVRFITADGQIKKSYTQNFLRFQLRWAPGEKFIQTYRDRHNVNRDAWEFIISHEFGPKNLFGSEYTLNLTEFSIKKRLWFSAFGYADISVKAAKLWNQVQFPALLWQNANISYTMQTDAYSLLNPMEFAMDQFVSFDLNYNLNGLIFNRIPLIKKLKIREVFTFKGFWGNLTKKNNPAYNDNLFLFPADSNTTLMGKNPYMEIGAGIDNILSFIRLDYVWRLSYRNGPNVSKSGLRFGLHFAF